MTFLLDTSAIVDYFRQKINSRELISSIISRGTISISIITYAELIHGTYRATNPNKEKERVDHFLNQLKVQIILLSQEMIDIYAKTKYLLEKKGQKIDEFDLLIAATAIYQNSTLVTSDKKHFSRITELNIL